MEKEELSPMQKVLLDVFKSFTAFCNENHIHYFAAYGTCLGAIRHKGFIPWDDDIDVFMIRPEYEKFLSLKNKLNGTGYKVADYHDIGYPYPFAKYYDESKTFWEYSHFPIVLGPWIDVFPLDSWDDADETCNQLFEDNHEAYWNYRKSIAHHPWKEIASDLCNFDFINASIKIAKKLYYKPQFFSFLRRIESVNSRLVSLQGPYYLDFSFLKSKKYNKEWFSSCIEVPFEDTTIFVPVDYDSYLKARYGDYMTPPPTHERTGHNAFYLNLEKRMSIKEILSEIKVVPQQRIGFSVMIDEIKHRKGFN